MRKQYTWASFLPSSWTNGTLLLDKYSTNEKAVYLGLLSAQLLDK